MSAKDTGTPGTHVYAHTPAHSTWFGRMFDRFLDYMLGMSYEPLFPQTGNALSYEPPTPLVPYIPPPPPLPRVTKDMGAHWDLVNARDCTGLFVYMGERTWECENCKQVSYSAAPEGITV